MKKASIDASQDLNSDTKVSTEANHEKEPEPRPSTDAGLKPKKQDKGKDKVDEPPKIYIPRVPFPSAL